MSDHQQSESAFPDLPPDLTPRRPEQDAPLTPQDFDLMRQTGATIRLDEVERRRAKKAVAHLQAKIRRISAEYNEGQINQAQYEALFTRYGEQMALLRSLLEQSPIEGTLPQTPDDASTGSLRAHHASQVMGCVLFNNLSGDILTTLGQFDLENELLIPILGELREVSAGTLSAGQRCTQIGGGRFLCIIPGEMTTTLVLYSREPSVEQLDSAVDAQRDFERLNRQKLTAIPVKVNQLELPQQTLFEDSAD